MRRLGLIVLLPVVWLPLLAFLLFVLPAFPWWAWAFAGLVWFRVYRWRRNSAAGVLGVADPAAARYSPVGSGGGF